MVFTGKMFEKHLLKSDILSKNQLPGFYIIGKLVKNELKSYQLCAAYLYISSLYIIETKATLLQKSYN